jgi:cbb3-type cytochrome oxidase subunit 3
MLAFVGVCAWAYSRKRRTRFDAAAQLPLEEDRS